MWFSLQQETNKYKEKDICSWIDDISRFLKSLTANPIRRSQWEMRFLIASSWLEFLRVKNTSQKHKGISITPDINLFSITTKLTSWSSYRNKTFLLLHAIWIYPVFASVRIFYYDEARNWISDKKRYIENKENNDRN